MKYSKAVVQHLIEKMPLPHFCVLSGGAEAHKVEK